MNFGGNIFTCPVKPALMLLERSTASFAASWNESGHSRTMWTAIPFCPVLALSSKRPQPVALPGCLSRAIFHLLLQTGAFPIATVMERLLTGYAAPAQASWPSLPKQVQIDSLPGRALLLGIGTLYPPEPDSGRDCKVDERVEWLSVLWTRRCCWFQLRFC
jgi:hypothetical protein